jgi:aspartate carbamoyltransferase catalytic subunit
MTIEEVRAHKELYARKIQDLVEQFHTETGFWIREIYIKQIDVTMMTSTQKEEIMGQVFLRLESI